MSNLTLEEKAAKWEEMERKREIQKKKDRYYADRAKHQIDELKRVVKENGLEDQLQEFPKTVEDYLD